jgi:hypothetical protein
MSYDKSIVYLSQVLSTGTVLVCEDCLFEFKPFYFVQARPRHTMTREETPMIRDPVEETPQARPECQPILEVSLGL